MRRAISFHLITTVDRTALFSLTCFDYKQKNRYCSLNNYPSTKESGLTKRSLATIDLIFFLTFFIAATEFQTLFLHHFFFKSCTLSTQKKEINHIPSPRLWNGLPENLRAAETVDVFKKRLKTHLFNQAFIWFYWFSLFLLIKLFIIFNFCSISF